MQTAHQTLSRSIAMGWIIAIFVALACGSPALAEERFEGWNLEPSLNQAHLVMVARVANISQVTIVEGAKTDTALREFRFQPVKVLKGIFKREQLAMTGADLGIANLDPSAPPPLSEGEFRLLILVQTPDRPSGGCVTSAPGMTTFAQRVPRLSGPDDPLVSAVDTLLQVAESRSRRQRAALLIERLAETSGAAAVPLLMSLQQRSEWAGVQPRALEVLSRLAKDPLPATRDATLKTLAGVLSSRNVAGESAQLSATAEALRDYLASAKAPTEGRLDAIAGLGSLLALDPELTWPRELLISQMTGAATYAERAAAVEALASSPHPDAAKAVLDALAALPLDEVPKRELQFAEAAVRLDSAGAEWVLLQRLERSIAARQSVESEVAPLGKLNSKASLPLLIAAASQITVPGADSLQIAKAFARIRDDQAVPTLVDWMRLPNSPYASDALAALEAIDSPLVARELRPLFKTESVLGFKLRIARLLARHGINDGYSLATEHLADNQQTALAALVLAALDDPRTATELSAILAARADRRWQSAALAGLSAVGNEQARKQIAAILADERNPLVTGAVQAAGLGGDVELLVPLTKLVRSRNQQIASVSLEAILNYFSYVRRSRFGMNAVVPVQEPLDANWESRLDAGDNERMLALRREITAAVRELALDTYVDDRLRTKAFNVARLVPDGSYPAFLEQLADQAELENKQLLSYVNTELRLARGAKP